MVHGKKLNLWDAYEWGKDVYVKIKQDDKLAPQASKINGLDTPHKAMGTWFTGQVGTKFQLKGMLYSIQETKLNYLLYQQLKNKQFLL